MVSTQDPIDVLQSNGLIVLTKESVDTYNCATFTHP
jgi:hypothetical protein